MEDVAQNVTKKGPSLKTNVFLYSIFRVLMLIAPFITAPYLSRVLLSDGIGAFSYTQSLVTYFTMFAALGTASYGTREIARKRDNKSEYSKSFWEIEIISVICSLIALTIWIVIALLYEEYRVYLLIFSFCIGATCLDISWLYAGLERYKYTISINLFFKIASVVMIFIFVKTNADVWIYILIYSLSLFAGNASMWLFLPKVLVKTQIDRHSLVGHFKETLIYFIPAVATSLYTVLDKTLIGVLISGNTDVVVNGETISKKTAEIESGYYEQATKIVDIVKTVAFVSMHTVVSSRASYLYKINDEKQIKQLSLGTLGITMFFSIGAMFGLIAVASIFVPLFFGPGYEKTILLLQVLSVLIPVICISGALGSTYYTPSGRRKQSSIYLIIGSIVNLALSIPMIILFKSVGAAIASLTAEVIIVILYFAKCKKAITFKEFLNCIWKKFVAGLTMGVVLYLFKLFLGKYFSNAIVYLLILLILGICTYIFMAIILRDGDVLRALKSFMFWKKRKLNHEKV